MKYGDWTCVGTYRIPVQTSGTASMGIASSCPIGYRCGPSSVSAMCGLTRTGYLKVGEG